MASTQNCGAKRCPSASSIATLVSSQLVSIPSMVINGLYYINEYPVCTCQCCYCQPYFTRWHFYSLAFGRAPAGVPLCPRLLCGRGAFWGCISPSCAGGL